MNPERFLAHGDPVGFLLHEVGDLFRDPYARFALMTLFTLSLSGSGLILRRVWVNAGKMFDEQDGSENVTEIPEPEIRD